MAEIEGCLVLLYPDCDLDEKKRIRLLIESNIQVDNGYVFPKDLRLSYIISPLELVLMHEDSGKNFHMPEDYN